MAKLNDILREMADQIEGLITLSVVGLDGLTVVEHNQARVNTDALSARFAMVMNMVGKSIDDLEEWGEFKENLILIQTSKAWILTRLLKNQCFLVIAVTREGNLRNVRLVAQKYAGQLWAAL
jgi:predicted regulator of Ras-like GTPase activity (Roadblock/LC7/MglB family)